MRTYGWGLLLSGGIAMACAALSQTAAADDAMRCGARLVTTGVTPAEVLSVCGEPAYRDPWLVPLRGRPGYASDVEEWYYDFGANQLLRILKFRQGRLADIATDGYGFDGSPRTSCGPLDLVRGASKYRLIAKCGEPAAHESIEVWEPLQRRDGTFVRGRFTEVYRQRWTYDFGSDYLIHFVTLDNGRVADVTTGTRGGKKAEK
jgi:hypothetical protein